MELRSEKVVERFKLYANEPMDGEEAQRDHLCQTLCQECTQWVQSQVRVEEREAAGDGAGLAEPEGLAVLESYAAAEAFYQLAVLDQASGLLTVTCAGAWWPLRGAVANVEVPRVGRFTSCPVRKGTYHRDQNGERTRLVLENSRDARTQGGSAGRTRCG